MLVLAAYLSLRSRQRLALLLGLCVVVLSGLLLALAQRDSLPETHLRKLLSRSEVPLGESVMFDGCVTEDSHLRAGEVVITVDLRAYRRAARWQPCRGRALLRMPEISSIDLRPEDTRFRAGDRLRGWSEWNVPRNFQNPGAADRVASLSRKGIFLTGRIRSPRLLETVPGDCGSWWGKLVASARNQLGEHPKSLERSGKKREAAVLESLVVGDYTDLDLQTRESFQNSGTYHVLVVSGLHVAWIAGVMLQILRVLRSPPAFSRIVVAFGILFYAGIVGFQASISRCLWMFALVLIGNALFRRASLCNIVFGSAFLILVFRPDWIFDAGFQLSFLSVIAICLTALPVIRQGVQPLLEPLKHAGDEERLVVAEGILREHGRRLRFGCELLAEEGSDRWGLFAGRAILKTGRASACALGVTTGMLLISGSVQIWLEPLLAFHFNRLSWIAPVANLVIVPLSSAVMAAGMIDSLTPHLLMHFDIFTLAAGWLSSVLLQAASWISGLPGAWQRCPTPAPGWVVAGLLLLLIWHFMQWRRPWIPLLYVAALLACLSYGFNPWAAQESRFEARSPSGPGPVRMRPPLLRVTFLDVGEGDSGDREIPGSARVGRGRRWDPHPGSRG